MSAGVQVCRCAGVQGQQVCRGVSVWQRGRAVRAFVAEHTGDMKAVDGVRYEFVPATEPASVLMVLSGKPDGKAPLFSDEKGRGRLSAVSAGMVEWTLRGWSGH